MSEENIELVRTLIPGPDTDVAALLRDDDLFERMASELEAYIDPEVKSAALWEPGATRTYVGIDGFRKLWLDWLEPWGAYYVEVDDLIGVDDRVVALIRDRGKRHDVDVEIELTAGSVWTIRDGKVVKVEFCTREDALEAAGRSG